MFTVGIICPPSVLIMHGQVSMIYHCQFNAFMRIEVADENEDLIISTFMTTSRLRNKIGDIISRDI